MKRYEKELELAKKKFKERYGVFVSEDALEYSIKRIEQYIEILKEIKLNEKE